jgi:3',5'-cyclic AMP phosphodiesterase CpdA
VSGLRVFRKRIGLLAGILIAITIAAIGVAVVYMERINRNNETPAVPLPANQNISLVFATDLHYLSPKLLDPDARLLSVLTEADGKMSQYSPQITDALIREVLELKPQALVLGGDLSFNGGKLSHQELSQKLQQVAEAGIPVLVVPGNHDINRPNTYHYTADGVVPAAHVSQNAFWNIYKSLGAEHAVSFDKNSLSYVYRISDDFELMMLDTSIHRKGNVQEGGKLSEQTLAWMKENLAQAQADGITVITVSHHNMLSHSSMFSYGFAIENYEEADAVLEKYGVRLNLSGHMHVQHIEESADGNLYDIATGSLSVNPDYIGLINIAADKSISYEAQSVDVEGWAKATGQTDANLLNFRTYAQNFFDTTSTAKVSESLAKTDYTEQQQTDMKDFLAWINRCYFSGIPCGVTFDDPIYKLWAQFDTTGNQIRYFNNVMAEKKPSIELYLPSISSGR